MSRAITSCFYHLRFTEWIHKSLNSTYIIYFNTLAHDLTKVNLLGLNLAGFQHDRQSGPVPYSSEKAASIREKAFVHPEYKDIGVKYHVPFDYHALGVILLEKAMWRPVEKMFLPAEESAEVLKTRPVECAMDLVSQRMGTGFRDVIIACLEFHEIYGSEGEGSSLVRKFQPEI